MIKVIKRVPKKSVKKVISLIMVIGLSGLLIWIPPKVKAAPGWPLLQQGSTGPNVVAVQYLLNYYGYGVAVDGQYGPGTANAVAGFQSTHGLSVDGQCGPQTLSYLVSLVYPGYSGCQVSACQYLLANKFGFYLPATGYCGGDTSQAIGLFQSAVGIANDTIAGNQTWQYLFGCDSAPEASHNVSCASAYISGATDDGYYVTVTGVNDPYGTRILFPSWTDYNGQDEITWDAQGYTGANSSYTYFVARSRHNNEAGQYYTHIYIQESNGSSVCLSGQSYNFARTISSATVTNVTDNGYDIQLTGVKDLNGANILFPTWTDYNGQDDIQWPAIHYTGSNSAYTFHVSRSDHKNEFGTYFTHIYIQDNNGTTTFLSAVSAFLTPAIGDAVNSPIPGFTRYDDTANSNLFVYNNMSYWSNGDTYNFNNGDIHVTTDLTQDASVGLTMQGTQFYLIVQCWDGNGGRNKNVDVYIDGAYYQTFSAPQALISGHVLYYISPVLSNGTHNIQLKYHANNGQMIFDAIDVKGSIVAPDTSVPSIPKNLSCASRNSSGAVLTWSASTDNVGVGGYNIYRDGIKIGSTASTSYTDSGLGDGGTYNYTVSAYDGLGNESAQSSAITVKTSGASFASALTMTAGVSQTGTLLSATDQLFYKINKSSSDDFLEAKIVDPVVSGQSLQYTVTLYDPNGKLLATQKSINGQDYVRCKITSAGDYYIKVSGDSGNCSATIPYTLTVH